MPKPIPMFRCPTCRSEINIPRDGTRGFQRNFYIDEDTSIPSRHFCAEHSNDEIKMVCKQCDKLLCIVCKLTNHENHPTVDTRTEAKEKRQALKNNIKDEERDIANFEKNRKQLEINKQTLVKKFGKDKDDIDNHIEKLVSKIKNEGSKAKKELETFYNADIKQIDTGLATLKTKTEKGQDSIKKLKHELDNDDDVKVLKSTAEVISVNAKKRKKMQIEAPNYYLNIQCNSNTLFQINKKHQDKPDMKDVPLTNGDLNYGPYADLNYKYGDLNDDSDF